MLSTARDQFLATVMENSPLCREHFRLVLKVSSFPPTDPGQFIQISCRDPDRDYGHEHDIECARDASGIELTSPLAMLRRPFSLAGRRDLPDGVELDIIHRVVGVGTDWLSRLPKGARVSILGPLGNHFTLPPENGTAILVGGGVGIPPMIHLAERLAGRSAVVFSGAQTRDLLPLTILDGFPPVHPQDTTPLPNIGEFARHRIPAVISTDDGSHGYRGFITQALETYLDREVVGKGVKHVTLYTCGPEPMMKRVADLAMSRGLDCQIAVERAMACGMGTCQSCCIKVRKPDPAQPPQAGKDWCYRLACTDGPVFHASDLLW